MVYSKMLIDLMELTGSDWKEVLGLLARLAFIFVAALGFACLPLASVGAFILVLMRG